MNKKSKVITLFIIAVIIISMIIGVFILKININKHLQKTFHDFTPNFLKYFLQDISKRSLRVRFASTYGINIGDTVRYKGEKVGKVATINYINDKEHNQNVEFILEIYKDIDIRTDTKITVNTLGLNQEKYVEISPGLGRIKDLKTEGYLEGENIISYPELTTEQKEILNKKIEETIKKLDK